MPPKTKPDTTPEQLLADFPPKVQFLAQKLRKLVKTSVPDASERVYTGWRGIGYRHPKAGYFCAIFLLNDTVKLGFEFGAFLPDPSSILKTGASKGKQVRYVEIASEDDLETDKLGELLISAIDFKS